MSMLSLLRAAVLLVSLLRLVVADPKCVEHNETFLPDAILRITAANHSQSCYPAKLTVLVNGTAPGPELHIKEGRTTWIRVYNDMDRDNLTMHWHGLSQYMSPFADGTPQVSQWPIPPKNYFDYEMHPEVGSAGTYFYHSHVGFQAVSCSGPLIVDDKHKPPYKYDDDKVIFLSDVFTKSNTLIEQGLVATPLNWSGETAMVLINGKGGGSNNGTFCNSSLSVIDVEPGKTYRLRFIASTALTFAHLEIEGHSMSVIEADGSYTKPYNTSFMQTGSGQRYSALLHTLDKPRKNGTYLIQIESRERPTITRGFAVLRYSDPKSKAKFYPPVSSPFKLANTSIDFLDYKLAPIRNNDFPTADEVTRRVTVVVHQSVQGMTVWKQNNVPWVENFPKEPYLVSLYKNDGAEFPSIERALANNGVDNVTRTFPARIGEVLEIIIQNSGADANGLDIHPFHAHGLHYYDIGAGNGTYNATANEIRLAKLGHTPVLRDTTILYRYGTTIKNGTLAGWRGWRLRVDQPGAWMIHCHILQHMIMGMQTVWVFGNETELLGKVPAPEVEGYLTYGGSVFGNESHYPSVVHFQDYETWSEDQ